MQKHEQALNSTSIILQPCKIRDTKLVELKENPITLNWNEYKTLLAPSKTIVAFSLLRKIQVGSYIGLVKKSSGELSNFLYLPNGNGDKATTLLRQLPDLKNRLHSLYKVLSFDFGSRYKE